MGQKQKTPANQPTNRSHYYQIPREKKIPSADFTHFQLRCMTKVNKKTFINIFKVFYIRKFFCHLTSPVSCLEMIECLTGIESSVSDPSRREIPCIVWRIEIDKTTPQTQEEWYYCFC